jgi:uncharacterized protein (DUF1919 family)
MKKKEDPNIFLSNQDVQRAMDQATIIDNRHFLTVSQMRSLLAKLEADYDLIARFFPEKGIVRAGFFTELLCIEDCLETLQKLDRLPEKGKSLWGHIPYRNIKHVNGKVSTMDYDT